MDCGDCFRLPPEKVPEGKRHLHAVITGPDAAGNVFTVYFNTAKDDDAPNLVIHPGAGIHPFITRPTVANYRDGRWPTPLEVLRRQVRLGNLVAEGRLEPELLRRIQTAALDMTFLAGDVKALIARSLDIVPPPVRTLRPRR